MKYKLKSFSFLYVDELKFLMLVKWKKKCLYDYLVVYVILLCDGELKYFIVIIVFVFVVILIIICVFN